jgi:hypothetical protein
VIETKKIKAHPPESPLNGGISQTIPLLGGECRLPAGRVLLIGHPEASYFEAVRTSSDIAGVILSGAFPREDLIF